MNYKSKNKERGLPSFDDNSVNFSHPKVIGFKWRYYLLGVTLLSTQKTSSVTDFIYLFFYIVFVSVPAVYPSIALTNHVCAPPLSKDSILPGSKIGLAISPGIFKIDSFDLIHIILLFLIVLIFYSALINPNLVLKHHVAIFHAKILNSRVHMIAMPLFVPYIRFCFSRLFKWKDSTLYNLVKSIISIALFILYVIGVNALRFIDANTIISPTLMCAEWFHGKTWIITTFSLVSAFAGYVSIHVAQVYATILFLIAAFVSFGTVIYIATTMPWMYFITNEIFASVATLNGLIYIYDIFARLYELELGNIFLVIYPLALVISFSICHFLFEIRRNGIHQLLNQIESCETQLTTQSLATTLSSVHTENKFQLIIKEGLLNGHESITSQAFIQFCLEMYPSSEWFLSYVTFLFAIIWGSYPDVYKVLLHLLSIDVFSGQTEFILFQFVYCYMQTAQHQSPIIQRPITKYRRTMMRFFEYHRIFWLSASHRDDSRILPAFQNMKNLVGRLHNQITTLCSAYAFCPVTHCEASIFYADILHDADKASKELSIAVSLLGQNSDYLTKTLFRRFSPFMPGFRRTHQQPQSATTFRFLSLKEFYDDAKRQTNSVLPNDTYLKTLTHTFKMEKNQPVIEPAIDKFWNLILKITIVLSIFIFVGLLISHHFINPLLRKSVRNYTDFISIIEQTLYFRNAVNMMEFDMALLSLIFKYDYPANPNSVYYYNFAIRHLNISNALMQYFKLDIDALASNEIDIQIVNSDCSISNCSFDYLYSAFHQMYKFLLTGALRMPNNFNDVDIYAQSMANILSKFYKSMYSWFLEQHKQTYNKVYLFLGLLVGIELGFGIIASIVMGRMIHQMSKNIFDIVKTAQPPIMTYIAFQFEKLLAFEEHQQPNLKSKFSFSPIFFFILSFVILSLQPIVCLYWTTRDKGMKFEDVQIPKLINFSSQNINIYYNIAHIEYFINNNTNNSGNYCMHDFLIVPCDKCVQHFKFYEDFSTDGLLILQALVCLIGSFIYVCFLRTIYITMNHFEIGINLLKFFPTTAVHSNPVFNKLILGESITTEDIYQFSENINTTPTDFSFFSILHISKDGRIKKIEGDVEDYIFIRPKTVEEMVKYIEETVDQDISDLFDFINKKIEGSSYNISLKPDHEVTLIYGKNGRSMVIKDDSHHYQSNAQLRLIRKLTDILDDFSRQNYVDVKEAGLLLVYSEDDSILHAVSDMIKRHNIFIRVDERYQEICYLMPTLEDKEKTGLMSILTELKATRNIKAVIHYGGPYHFFDTPRNQIPKSRIYGQAFDDSRLLIKFITLGDIVITQELVDKIKLVFVSPICTEISVSTDRKIHCYKNCL